MDVSFHPVDVALFHERLIPFVRGQGAIDDLVAEAVRVTLVTQRANAWGLAVLALWNRESERRYQEKSARRSSAALKPARVPKKFDADLHVWGRPFFITVDDPVDVSEAVDRYLTADYPGGVDALAREMLRYLGPDLEKHVKPRRRDLAPPDAEGVGQALRGTMELFRQAYRNLPRGEPVLDPDGEHHEPDELLAHSFPLSALAFAARIRPGWMAQGYVWPSYLFEQAGFNPWRHFQKAKPLFGPLLKEVPGLGRGLERTLICNYMVGGYVPAKKVPAFRRAVQKKRQALGAPTDCDSDVGKILEAAYDAERRGLAFLEAAEVYSGIMGILN
jgi:hypothetical protein